MRAWDSILKTTGFFTLLLFLLFAFFSWALAPWILPREYVNKKKTD
jgi:hypothetical protein